MLENESKTKNRADLSLKTRDIVAAYTLLRIVVGINYFNHGATRIFNIPGFMDSCILGQNQRSFSTASGINSGCFDNYWLIYTLGINRLFYFDGCLDVWHYHHSKLGWG
jgi:hypothetical protein